MVKVRNPLLSQEAHGTVGEVLTYSSKKTGTQVRFQRRQKDYENTAREAVRDNFKLGIELWNYLPQNEKDYWRQISSKGYADV